MYIVYSNQNEVFVTTQEQEAAFIEKMTKDWHFNLDKDNGDFDRQEILGDDPCVRIRPRKGFLVD
jgi:hypothetical protein